MIAILLILFYGVLLFLCYSILSKFGKKRIGKILCIALGSVLMISFFSASLDDFFFTKRDAVHYLDDLQISLSDDFKVVTKDFSNDIDISYKIFELRISPRDKQRIIQQIKNSKSYKDSVDDAYDFVSTMDRQVSPKVFAGFRTSKAFVLQSYEQDYSGSSPNSKVEISIADDILRYQRVWGD